MSRNTTAQPGPVAHGICVVLCLLLTLCLLAAGLALPAVRLLTDRDFDLSVAQDTAVVDAQYARIGEKIDALAAQYGFEPKTVMDLVTRERLLDYHAQMVDWLLSLPQVDWLCACRQARPGRSMAASRMKSNCLCLRET